jgi:hypothetical protein
MHVSLFCHGQSAHEASLPRPPPGPRHGFAPLEGLPGAFRSGGVGGFHGTPVGVQHGSNFGAFHSLGTAVSSGGSGAFRSGIVGGSNGWSAGVRHGGNVGQFRSPRVGSRLGSFSAWHSGVGEKRGPGVTWRSAGTDGRQRGDWRWHKGYWHNGYWHNGWWGPAFVTGVAVGAFATCPSSDGCWVYQPMYDAYGNYLGRECVNVCY